MTKLVLNYIHRCRLNWNQFVTLSGVPPTPRHFMVPMLSFLLSTFKNSRHLHSRQKPNWAFMKTSCAPIHQGGVPRIQFPRQSELRPTVPVIDGGTRLQYRAFSRRLRLFNTRLFQYIHTYTASTFSLVRLIKFPRLAPRLCVCWGNLHSDGR